MQRFLLLFASFFTLLMVHGQGVVHQKGYVRSVGRPDNKSGKRLPGAVIKVNGQHNTVRSGQNGQFTLEFNGLREGKDSYSFSSVRLVGYDLQENGMLGRRYPLSSTVPVEVVLVPQALKVEIEERVRHTVETQYQKKLKRIEALRAKDAERYRAELLRLESEYEKRDQLINDMVERYASTDYAHLDALSARVNELIELGELERADSLINAQDITRLESEHAALQARTEQLRANLSQSESATQASLHQLMSLYEAKRDIHIARYENDSAAVYWEKIVKLDTTNVDNLLRAGLFVESYLADFDKAMILFKAATRSAIAQHQTMYVGTSYNNMGTLYERLGQYSLALEYCKKALSAWQELLGDESILVAVSYDNLGAIYNSLGQYAISLENHEKALNIRLKECGAEHQDVAMCYNNIGSTCWAQGQYASALEYNQKALAIWLKVRGEVNSGVAQSYNNIGVVYSDQGQQTLALENHEKALAIRLKLYGAGHPDVATSYNNIGLAYANLGQYALAKENFEKALSIWLKVYGEEHSLVATVFGNLASVYLNKDQDAKALEYNEKALSIRLKVLGEGHPDVALSYNNIGALLGKQGQYALAIENYEKALAIFLKSYGDGHPYLATSYANIGAIYMQLQNYRQALENFDNAIQILEKSDDEKSKSAYALLLYYCHCKYYAQSPKTSQAGYEDFIASHFITATITSDSPAAKLGLDGTYYILEYGEWQAGSMESLFDVKNRLNGQPKDVILYRDGIFIKKHFDGDVDVQWGIISIDKDVRKAIVKAWKKWKE